MTQPIQLTLDLNTEKATLTPDLDRYCTKPLRSAVAEVLRVFRSLFEPVTSVPSEARYPIVYDMMWLRSYSNGLSSRTVLHL
jgi:hypothetical protein